jgi:hypothetical protein
MLSTDSGCLDAVGSICKAHIRHACQGELSDTRGQIMTSFDKREEGFEKKFAHDEEQLFKAHARRDKLLGLWAADKLGLTGADAEAYAQTIVTTEIDTPGDEGIFLKIRKDFDAKNIAQSDPQIRRAMDEMLKVAIAQIRTE